MDYLLEARNLGMKFDGEKYLFRHVNFAFPDKGMFALLGPSGSGKSTFMHLLSGLLPPSEGKVFFCGKDINKMTLKEKSFFHGKMVSFLFQHYELLDGHSAVENVVLPLRMAGSRKKEADQNANELLAKLGLGDKRKIDVSLLSGGERQRVGLARALVSNPKILFCDEPTGALDSESASRTMEILKEESQKRLVLLVSHNVALVKAYADAVISVTGEEIILPALSEPPRLTIQPNEKVRMSKPWKSSFLLAHFKEDSWKNILGFVSGYVGFSMLLLSFGFSYGSKDALMESAAQSPGYGYTSLTKKERMEIPGSNLTLSKERMPSLEESEALFDQIGVSIERDYRYFFPSDSPFGVEGKNYPSTSLEPVYQSDGLRLSSLLIEGSPFASSSFYSIYINDSLSEEYGVECGDIITLPLEFTYVYRGLTEEVSTNLSFEVAGISRDFAFMGRPTIYYSYPGLVEMFRNLPLPKIQERYGGTMNLPYCLDLQETEGNYLSTHRLVFALEGEADSLREMERSAKEESSAFSLTSPSFEAEYSFLLLCEAFDSALLLFSSIAAISLAFLLGMSGYSCFYSHKRESAILRVLGAKEGDVCSLFMEETMFISFASMLAALLSSPSLSRLLNGVFLKEFGISSLIRIPFSSFLGIPYGLPLFAILIALLFGLFSVWFPLRIHKNAPLASEVRDE